MSILSKVSKGKIIKPPLWCVYGLQGIGKTTLASKAPSPIFICAESGTDHIDTSRFTDAIKTYEDVLACVTALMDEEHEYQTLVIDSLDWLEPMIHSFIARRYKKTSIEQAAGGFGKGYVEAAEELRAFFKQLDMLRDKRKMGIILVAHPEAKDVTNPQTQTSYHRYELKLRPRAKYLVYEFVDAVFFATYLVEMTAADEGATHLKTDKRVIYGVHDYNDGFDAKNRYGLKAPLSMDLSWAQMMKLCQLVEGPPPASDSLFQLSKLIPLIKDDEMRAKVQESVMEHAENPAMLHKMLIKVRTMTDDAPAA